MRRTPRTKPNDPNLNQQWALEKIGATKAWNTVTGNPVICAVIDTGVDYTHPDLVANMWKNLNEIPDNGIDDDSNGYIDDVYGYDFPNNDGDPMDDHDHGTAIAGVIAAVGNNNTDVAGINWSAKIMALKAIGIEDTTGTTNLHVDDAIDAIEYAVKMGAKVINASWHLPEINDNSKKLLYEAIKKAQDAGILFITAAGNASKNIDLSPQYPASYELENIISVAATAQNDELATFEFFQMGSNYGLKSVDLGAPGLDIYSLVPSRSLDQEPISDGSSSATAYVSGTVTLLWSVFPKLTATKVKAQIMDSVDEIPALEGKTVTGGRLNVYKAITALPLPKPVITISPTRGNAPLEVKASASSSGEITNYKWFSSDNQEIVGQKAHFTFKTAGKYSITLIVIDNNGATATVTESVIVRDNNYKVSGVIKDKVGNPISGVTVLIDDQTAVTDVTGSWEITDLMAGKYTATTKKEGYQSASQDFSVGNEQNATVDFILKSLLNLKMVSKPRIAKQGENISYTITVKNDGSDTATGVTLEEILPTNTRLVSIEALEGGSCDANTITCRLPELTPSATASVKVVISNTQAETLDNTVIVATNEYPMDVQKTLTSVIPYLSVSIMDSPDPVEIQKTLFYTVIVELSHEAPTEATGVKLVTQLPKGVELQSISSDYSMCDTSPFPRITCILIDLSIGNQVSVEMEVELKDGGLLLLTHEAEITANEYPTHHVRERTHIFIPPEIQVDLVLVIDVTGSMQEEINGVIKALQEFIVEQIDASTAPLMALVTFRDEVKVSAFTYDFKVLLDAIKILKAKGGGSCPEASAEALLIAVSHIKDGGNIFLITDASPYEDTDIEQVMTLLRSKGIRFNAMITGDCSQPSSQNSLLSD